MPAYARSEIIDEKEIGTYHVINRCVRRAFLCGKDAVSGKNFDHRKYWIKNRLSLLSKIFAVEIGHYAIMDNHFHCLLTNRPDLVRNWTDEEVVRRWWQLYPKLGLETVPEAIKLLWLADREFLEERRNRLSSISWFMRCLSEPIAKRANREDGVTGRFWQGRFISKKVLNRRAALETGIYIDLNPFKARLVANVENSKHNSLEERILAIINNTQLFIQPIQAIMHKFSEETPYLLEDEKDYIELVKFRSYQLSNNQKDALILNSIHSRFSSAIGDAPSLRAEARARGKKWLKGVRYAEKLFW